MTVERELRLAELAAVCWLSTCQTGVAGSRPFYVAAFGRVVIGGGPTPRLSVVDRSAGRCGGLGAVSDAALNHPFTERAMRVVEMAPSWRWEVSGPPNDLEAGLDHEHRLGLDVNHDREDGQRSRHATRFGRVFGCRRGRIGRQCRDRRQCRFRRQRDHGRQCRGGRQRGDGRQILPPPPSCRDGWQCRGGRERGHSRERCGRRKCRHRRKRCDSGQRAHRSGRGPSEVCSTLACVSCTRCVACSVDCVDCVGCIGCDGLRGAIGQRLVHA